MTHLPHGRFLLLLLLVTLSQSCKKHEDVPKKEDEAKKEVAISVEYVEIGSGRMEAVLKTSANLEAEAEVKVMSRTSNRVAELKVEEGDHVSKGQPLLRLEDRTQKLAVEKSAVDLEKARREQQRQASLHAQKMTSDQVYNDAVSDLERAELAHKQALQELEYTIVLAPIRGKVTSRLVNLGDEVNPNQQLFDIVDFDSIVARIHVPDKYMGQLREGMEGRLSSVGTGERAFIGKIKRIAPTVDPKTGTIKVTVGVGDTKALLPGMYVDVELVLSIHKDAILIPKQALVYDNDQMYLFRLGADKRVEKLLVEAQLSDRFNIEPVAGIVALGDKIITAGQVGLKEKSLVEAIEVKMNPDGGTTPVAAAPTSPEKLKETAAPSPSETDANIPAEHKTEAKQRAGKQGKQP